MNNPLYAMDTCFRHAHGRYAPKARAEMLTELGFAGTTLTLGDDQSWAEPQPLLEHLDARGLTLFGIYLVVDVADDSLPPRLPELIDRLAGRPTLIEVAMLSRSEHDKPSAPRADPRAAERIKQIADLARPAKLRVSLYPHINFWLERIDDAVRLAMRVNRPDVGVTFNLFHWLAADGQMLDARLQLAHPRMWNLTINGATLRGPRDCTIEPLGQGRFDVFWFLTQVARLGYSGPVGLQGYGVGGDVFANLRQSMSAWRDLTSRLVRHADWGRLV